MGEQYSKICKQVHKREEAYDKDKNAPFVQDKRIKLRNTVTSSDRGEQQYESCVQMKKETIEQSNRKKW